MDNGIVPFQPPPTTALTCDAPSPFPPSFDGQPGAYTFGLFGDIMAAALALAILLDYALEAHRKSEVRREMKRRTDAKTREQFHEAHSAPVHRRSTLFAHRALMIGLLLFVVMRALPDAVWMLLWGEINEAHIRAVLWGDLMLDGAALIPLFVGAMYWAWSKQALSQKLMLNAHIGELPKLSFQTVWRNVKIVLLIFVIAVGVTIGKASSG